MEVKIEKKMLYEVVTRIDAYELLKEMINISKMTYNHEDNLRFRNGVQFSLGNIANFNAIKKYIVNHRHEKILFIGPDFKCREIVDHLKNINLNSLLNKQVFLLASNNVTQSILKLRGYDLNDSIVIMNNDISIEASTIETLLNFHYEVLSYLSTFKLKAYVRVGH